MSLLFHGGRLRQAAAEYQIPLADWLDLSTGISPWAYPVPSMAPQVWQRLPETNDGLELAAFQYYYQQFTAQPCDNALPLAVAGSQAAIQALPWLLAQRLSHTPLKAVLPAIGYKEHEKAWRRAGWQIDYYQSAPSRAQLDSADALLIINPNNPSGQFHHRQCLQQWQQSLAARGAYLILDEAFVDLWPTQSLIYQDEPLCPEQFDCWPQHLVVLRSIGKFFGLAGARIGFVFASICLKQALQTTLGPWTICGAARQLGQLALLDQPWQQQQRLKIKRMATQLVQLLELFFSELVNCELFITVKTTDAIAIHRQFAQQGIFLRLTDEQDGLRFGLPENDQQLARLAQALTQLSQHPQGSQNLQNPQCL